MRKLTNVAFAVGLIAATPALFEELLLLRATSVLTRVLDNPRPAIPQAVLERTRAVVVLPGVQTDQARDARELTMTGVLSARGASFDHWSPPAIVELRGRLAGNLELGAADIILMAQTARGLDALTAEGESQLGSVTIAPGPVSKSERVVADVVAYVRFDAYFAGVGIDDWTIEGLDNANAALYGRRYSTDAIVHGQGFFQIRPAARAWREALSNLFGRMS